MRKRTLSPASHAVVKLRQINISRNITKLKPSIRASSQYFEHFDFGFKFDDGVLSPPKLSREKLKPYLDLDKEVDICRADEKRVGSKFIFSKSNICGDSKNCSTLLLKDVNYENGHNYNGFLDLPLNEVCGTYSECHQYDLEKNLGHNSNHAMHSSSCKSVIKPKARRFFAGFATQGKYNLAEQTFLKGHNQSFSIAKNSAFRPVGELNKRPINGGYGINYRTLHLREHLTFSPITKALKL